MQFRRQGGRVQVLAYRGYDKEKRRSVVKMLGSYDAYTFEPTAGLLENMTDKEREELQAHIEAERKASERQRRLYTAKYIASQIAEVADTLKAGEFEPTAAWAADVWASIAALSKAMRKAGYPKPRKARKASAAAPPPSQGSLPLDAA